MVTVPRSLQGRVALTTIPQLGNTAYYELRGYPILSSVERPAGFWGSSASYTLVRIAKILETGPQGIP